MGLWVSTIKEIKNVPQCGYMSIKTQNFMQIRYTTKYLQLNHFCLLQKLRGEIKNKLQWAPQAKMVKVIKKFIF
jgi:glutaredoxin-related protein